MVKNIKKVMICDDAKFVREEIKKSLKKYYHKIKFFETTNGQELIDFVSDEKNDGLDLIFLDLTMPVMDGLEAVRKLKKMKYKTPIVMASGISSMTIVFELVKHGIKEFIRKPVEREQVEDCYWVYLHPFNKKEMTKNAFLAFVQRSRLLDEVELYLNWGFIVDLEIVDYVIERERYDILRIFEEYITNFDSEVQHKIKGERLNRLFQER